MNLKTIKSMMKVSIKKENARELFKFQIYEKCIEALKQFEGKTVSKRMTTAIFQKLGNYNVRYEKKSSMFYAIISPMQANVYFENGYDMSILLCYESSPFYNQKETENNRGFEYHNCCYGSAAIERVAKRNAFLTSEKFNDYAKAVKKIIEAKAVLKDIDDYDISCRHELDRIFDFNTRDYNCKL